MSVSKERISRENPSIQMGSLLESVFDNSFGWVLERKSFFSVHPYKNTPRLLDLIKPMGELMLVADLLLRTSHRKNDARDLLDFGWEELEKGKVLESILCSRPDLLTLSAIYAVFHVNGYHSESLKTQIERVVKTPGYFNLDLPAWRRLDLLHGLSSLNINTDQKISSVFKNSWLAEKYSYWTITDATAYGVTHTVFYMTDYGRKPDGLPEDIISYLSAVLPKWAEHYLQEGNYDLASEMFMSMGCIDTHPPYELINQFSAGQRKDGSYEGPPFGALNLVHGESDEERIGFLSDYHTTLVACMAAYFCSPSVQLVKSA